MILLLIEVEKRSHHRSTNTTQHYTTLHYTTQNAPKAIPTMSLDLYFCSLRNQHNGLLGTGSAELMLVRDDAVSRKKSEDFQRFGIVIIHTNNIISTAPSSCRYQQQRPTNNNKARNRSFSTKSEGCCERPPSMPMRLKSPAGSLRKTLHSENDNNNTTIQESVPALLERTLSCSSSSSSSLSSSASSISLLQSIDKALCLLDSECCPMTPRRSSNRRSSYPTREEESTFVTPTTKKRISPPRVPTRTLSPREVIDPIVRE